MTDARPMLELDRDRTEQRDWGVRFLVSGGIAAWILSGAFGSSGGGSSAAGGEPAWNVVVQVMPEVQGAVLGLIALGWLVTQWQRQDRDFVLRVRRIVLLTAWGLVAVAIVGSYTALMVVDRPPSSPPLLLFPLEAVDAYAR